MAGTSERTAEGLRVRVVDPAAEPRWDAYVRAHPGAAVYHLSAWTEVMREAYGFEPCSVMVEEPDGAVRGVLPLVTKRGLVTSGRVRSLPSIPFAGPLGDGPEHLRRLVAAACDLSAERRRTLTINALTGGLDDLEPRLATHPVAPTWVLPVPPDAGARDAWLRARSKNLRRSIARSEKAGVSVRLSDSDADLRSFYRLYLMTMRRHRSVPRTLGQLRSARRLLGPEGIFRLFVAEHGGRMAAGGVFHVFNGTIELLYNSSDPDTLDHRPNHALYSAVLDWAAEHGCERLDFGQAWADHPLGQFKAQWGAEAVAQYRYFVTGEAQGGDATELTDPGVRFDRARLGAGRVLDAAWGRSPLWLTAAVGRVGYRYL